ncbi:FAD-dependent oxidoreductase [Phenylobacterium sp. J426]|uniref:FAD-dependent oxidoreductase n=1 Tax=Phenylobacterium sp. J426 TaxID=2898439 RepID=UPI0027E2DFD6|nr:FAD-dependent oxidoreductase [Phenylobacterium sp. J426]
MDEHRFGRRRIAVIGGGIAGLSAAWLLSKRHEVVLYEADPRLGGHAHTVEVQGDGGPVPVDTGFIVFNEANYPNFTALLAHLGAPSQHADMALSVSLDDGAFEYSSYGALRNLRPEAQPVLRPLLADAAGRHPLLSARPQGPGRP